ncbi:MAG: hypothetical protein WBM70_09980 [Sulfurovum sp.]|uniref:hypothetical protein n=1 Tax=Sulfurovum sp. TaxID=1969726 RepID=UPI003C791378
MDFLALLFVAKPFNILVVAVAFLGAYFILQWFDSIRQTRLLLIASIAWGLYAAWELLVQIRTPEANIRVDLLMIWPLLAMLSSWALYRVLRR